MDNLPEILGQDPDGLATYEYIVNNYDTCIDVMPSLVDNLMRVDRTGQFLASGARFLSAVDPVRFAPVISDFIKGAIDRDRERKYIGSLREAIWGPDYKENAERLKQDDDNFRRIYKRIYPSPESAF